jgi:hypothetical protein
MIGAPAAVVKTHRRWLLKMEPLERLASLQPTTLACMHGSAWAGDGAGLIRELAALGWR